MQNALVIKFDVKTKAVVVHSPANTGDLMLHNLLSQEAIPNIRRLEDIDKQLLDLSRYTRYDTNQVCLEKVSKDTYQLAVECDGGYYYRRDILSGVVETIVGITDIMVTRQSNLQYGLGEHDLNIGIKLYDNSNRMPHEGIGRSINAFLNTVSNKTNFKFERKDIEAVSKLNRHDIAKAISGDTAWQGKWDKLFADPEENIGITVKYLYCLDRNELVPEVTLGCNRWIRPLRSNSYLDGKKSPFQFEYQSYTIRRAFISQVEASVSDLVVKCRILEALIELL